MEDLPKIEVPSTIQAGNPESTEIPQLQAKIRKQNLVIRILLAATLLTGGAAVLGGTFGVKTLNAFLRLDDRHQNLVGKVNQHPECKDVILDELDRSIEEEQEETK